MSKSLINLGATPNDRTGDTLRDAGSKINTNTNELYTALGDGSVLQVAVSGATSGQVLKFNGTAFVPADDQNTDAVTSVNGEVGIVVLDTDLVDEGETNQYYTVERAQAAISVDEASTQLAYEAGVISFTQGNSDTVAEGTNNLYYTSGRFDFTLSQKTTNDLIEGTTNKYFSNSLARSAISVTGDLNYSQSTGVISYTTPAIPADVSDLTDTTTLLFSGSYTDLTDIPTAFTADKIATATAPASPTDTGTAGEVRYDADFIYVCVATDTWVRAALLTWV